MAFFLFSWVCGGERPLSYSRYLSPFYNCGACFDSHSFVLGHLFWSLARETWAEGTLAGSAQSRHCALSLLARYPRRWRTLKPGANPIFLRGSTPPGNREAKESGVETVLCLLWVVSQWLTFQRGPSRKKPAVSFQDSPHSRSGCHTCL